jgi:hypothetical protein
MIYRQSIPYTPLWKMWPVMQAYISFILLFDTEFSQPYLGWLIHKIFSNAIYKLLVVFSVELHQRMFKFSELS